MSILKSVDIHNKFFFFLLSHSGGHIKLFRREEDSSFKLIIEATDPDPIPVEYIHFGNCCGFSSKFYFNCSFGITTPDLDMAAYHPLLIRDALPSTTSLTNCKTLTEP